ncbi:SMC (structural maintenance of chromosomes) domain-containing protein [Histoplasma ohiense]|nr:SMC (structural maintenance of chromosomes) domain-containing protein [Histoplasma ohiense (nom. inval.)]
MMDTLDLQDVKLQQAVDRWNEFTTWLQELQENMQSLRVALETKGKEVKDLAMGFANLKENQKEDLQVAQRTLKDTQTAILELKKKITSSSKRTDELVQEIDTLKVQTNNNQKTEMSTVVLADQIDKLQAKAASSEEAIRKLNREWELWMQVDDVSEAGGSIQGPNTQAVGVRLEVESAENIANTKTGDLDTLKHAPQEPNNRTDEIQEKLRTHEAAVQRLSDELEALRNDKQGPINQFELLQNKIGTCEEATNTLVRDFEKFKNTTLESKSQSGELRGKLKSHEEILQRLSNDLRELNNKKDSNNEFKELVEKIRSCDAAIEGLTKELETKKNDQQGSQPDMKIEKLKSTLNQVDTIALTTRCDVDRITTQIKEFGLSTQTCRTLLTQQGIEIFKIREKLGITSPLTSPLDIERGMVQKDVAKSAAMFAQVSSGKKSTKDNRNEPPQTSTVPGDDKPSPSTVTSETQLKEKLSWRDATSASEGTTSKESAKPSTQSTTSTSLASAPVASTPAPKRQAPKQQDKNISRWDPVYVESADIPEVEEKISQAAPRANPGLKGASTKESGDPSKQITSSSKSSAYPPSSDPASNQPDENMSRWDPAYVGPEGALSHNKKVTKKKTFRK